MGYWEEYCLICGGPLKNNFAKGKEIYDSETDTSSTIIIKEYDWLNYLYFIQSNGDILKTDGSAYTDNGEIVINKKAYVITPIHYHSKFKNAAGYGVICHQDCYDLLKTKLKYNLQFGDVCRLLGEYNCLLKQKSKYGAMEKYVWQDFDYLRAHEENSYLLESPLINKKNQQRVLKIWTPLVKKFMKTPLRESPCESATQFRAGTVLLGNNNKPYIVKNYNGIKKWIPYEIESKGSRKSKK